MTRYHIKASIAVSIFLMAFCCPLPASDFHKFTREELNFSSDAPYCGIYCLYAVMRLEGIPVRFSGFVDPKYLGSEKGSSVSELRIAAIDRDLYVEAFSGLSIRTLEETRYPVILHVKSRISDQAYDHYVLFINSNNGIATVLDPPNNLRKIPLRELDKLWNGIGIVISKKPIDTSNVTSRHLPLMIILLSIVAIGLLYIQHRAKMYFVGDRHSFSAIRHFFCSNSLSSLAGTCCIIVAIMMQVGILIQLISSNGLLANPKDVQAVVASNATSFMKKLTANEVDTLLTKNVNSTLVIDARLVSDYNRGHIPGAINVPITSTNKDLRDLTSQIPHRRKIVIYCQSSACDFDEKIAKRLYEMNFSNINIFRGGWVEWKSDPRRVIQQ